MLDIHTHLHFTDYDNDREEVVKRAREAGVKKMICVGTSPEDWEKAIAVAEKYDNVYASVGIHPHFFNQIKKEFQISNFKFQNKSQNQKLLKINELTAQLKKIAQSSDKVIAIGECGLDYFSRIPEKVVMEEQKTLQKEGFIAQIELAKELKLPLIIHTRPSVGSNNAYEDMFDIFKHHLSFITHLSSPLILHCYQGDTEITKKFLELPDVYFSFAGNITYQIKKSVIGTKDDLQETLKLIPLERLFAETDCPYLAPEGKRGERNEPAYVQITVQKIRALKGIAMNDLEAVLDENFQKVFAR